MTNEQVQINYLESKLLETDLRKSELEAIIMLILFRDANPINPDYVYMEASRALWRGAPFSNEAVKMYLDHLENCKKLNGVQKG